MDDFPRVWGGMYSHEALMKLQELSAVGFLRKSHYVVTFRPFLADGPIGQLPIFQNENLQAGWLVTSTDLSLVDAQSDSVQVGHYQHNYLTGNNSNEISITMLETKSADVMKSFQGIKDVMFNRDGTQGLPADYMFYVSVGVFTMNDRDDVVFEKASLVMLQSAKIDLGASNRDVLDVPLTFTKVYPMLR